MFFNGPDLAPLSSQAEYRWGRIPPPDNIPISAGVTTEVWPLHGSIYTGFASETYEYGDCWIIKHGDKDFRVSFEDISLQTRQQSYTREFNARRAAESAGMAAARKRSAEIQAVNKSEYTHAHVMKKYTPIVRTSIDHASAYAFHARPQVDTPFPEAVNILACACDAPNWIPGVSELYENYYHVWNATYYLGGQNIISTAPCPSCDQATPFTELCRTHSVCRMCGKCNKRCEMYRDHNYVEPYTDPDKGKKRIYTVLGERMSYAYDCGR